jgi:DNA gyrase/topoisomerase IV subunit B
MSAAKSKGTAGYQIFSLAESARAKGMWAGALERTSIPGLSGIYPAPPPPAPAEGDPAPPPGPADTQYQIREIKRDHTPAILKIIDEGLVNASDHKKEHEDESKAADRVSRISLDFDREAGRFVIENDGPGIPIVVHEEASANAGRDVYVPEVAFALFLAGRNMEKPPDSVKGGINGIGGKLINVHSTLFAIETVADDSRGVPTVYLQIFRDRMRVREDPKMFSTRSAEARKLPAERRRPHTRITFVPAYAELGYAPGPKGPLAPQDADDLEAWCRWRMFLLAAYVGPKVAVVFNGERCPTTSAKALAALAVAHDPEAIVMGCTAKAAEAPHSAHPWDIAVAVVPSSKRFAQLSVINGVHCAKGSHVTYLKKLINEAVGAKLARATKSKDKKTSVTDTCKQVFLVSVGALPGADWGGQRKDELQVAEAKLRPYTIAASTLGKIATTIADNLLRAAEKGVRGRKKRVEAEKYTRARRAGTKDSAQCALLAAEGDSAITLLRAGLTLGPKKNPGGPSFEHFGIISLGGVIMNAMKKITEVETAGGETVIVRSEQLRNNKVLKAIVEVLGLDFTCRYETDAEVARLRYGAVIVATDQDLDGTGKILPLVLVWFHVFWPNLIARGYVKRYMTPVIRAYPKARGGGPREFFYENEFDHWVAEQGGEASVSAGFNVKYYKGLATHDEDEVVEMFKRFTQSVYTFTLDDTAAELFEVYFGSRPSLRKTALATPVAYLSYEEAQEIHRCRLIPCSTQLRVDAKAYKLDDIQRKIPGVADGIPVARRKVLAGALRRFASSNREVKVFQLGGYVAEHMFYHHGDASLNGTIVGMAQRFPGALMYPYLSGIGQYGSRHFGGDDAGSPRYINVRLAGPFAKAMFPAEDTCMLPHVFEDGERAQPKYFLGVLPTPLLESFEIPSEGWRHKSFARELDDVLRLARAYVGGDELVARVAAAAAAAPPGTGIGELGLDPADLLAFDERYPLAVSLRGYGEHLDEAERKELVRPYKGYLHTFGWYWPEHGSGNAATTVLHVTELPIRKTTQSFLKDLEKPARAKYIDEVDDYSSDTKVDVRIRLVPGAWDEICAAFGGADVDAVEDFLLLRASLKPYLNYYGEDGGVIEFGDDYHAVFFHWAPLRRDMYRQRLEREAVLLALKIRLEREVVRYIGVAHELNLAKKADEAVASAALAARDFPEFDSGLLAAPRFTPTAEIEHLVTRGISVSHDYILSLRERDLVQSAKVKREEKIRTMVARLAGVENLLGERPFAGASVWAAEIEQVVAAIARGEKTRWRF